MARAEQIASSPKVNVETVNSAGFQQLGYVIGIAVPGTQDSIAEQHRTAVWIYVAKAYEKIRVHCAGCNIQPCCNWTCNFEVCIERRRGEGDAAAFNRPLIFGTRLRIQVFPTFWCADDHFSQVE